MGLSYTKKIKILHQTQFFYYQENRYYSIPCHIIIYQIPSPLNILLQRKTTLDFRKPLFCRKRVIGITGLNPIIHVSSSVALCCRRAKINDVRRILKCVADRKIRIFHPPFALENMFSSFLFHSHSQSSSKQPN